MKWVLKMSPSNATEGEGVLFAGGGHEYLGGIILTY